MSWAAYIYISSRFIRRGVYHYIAVSGVLSHAPQLSILAVGSLVQGSRSFTAVVFRLVTGLSVISVLFSFAWVTGPGLSPSSIFSWLAESGPPGDCIGWAGGGGGFAGESGPLFGLFGVFVAVWSDGNGSARPIGLTTCRRDTLPFSVGLCSSERTP